MSTAPFDPRFDPPRQDSQTLVHMAVCLLCVAVFLLLTRGCSSQAHAPERRFELVPDHISDYPHRTEQLSHGRPTNKSSFDAVAAER